VGKWDAELIKGAKAVAGLTSIMLIAKTFFSSFKIHQAFFWFANDLQIARSLCILPTELPSNIYQYFNQDLKIFNFELPRIPNLVSNWYSLDFHEFTINNKFKEYGIEVYAFANITLSSFISFLPLFVFYIFLYIFGKIISIKWRNFSSKFSEVAKSSLLFNYPLWYFL